MKIDWDAVRELLPIYAYEYTVVGENVDYTDYWYPHLHKGKTPPPGWTGITREEDHPELWHKAINEWVDKVLTPNETAVWLDMNTWHFSNSFKRGELLDSTLKELDERCAGKENWDAISRNWKLIIYRCDTDPDFQFSDMMKIVSTTKEDRKR